MYSFNNKQYVFKQLSGKLWNIYYDAKLGICYSTLTKRNTWTEPIPIERKAYQYFYTDMDDNECFHLIYQDLHGNIFYSKLDNGLITTLPILNSKSPSLYNKHLYLIPVQNNIHFLYILLYNNNILLTHQILVNGSVGSPKVIDYVYKNNLPYSTVLDKSGDIYAFYQSANSTPMQFGYRIFSSTKNLWSDFLSITSPGTNCDFPSIIVDNSNVMHICFQKQSIGQYELVYKQKMPEKILWSDETVIHSSIYPFENSSIISIDDKIFIYWVRNDIIYYSFSKNKGISWSKPSRYNFPVGRNLLCLSYKTNIPYELNRIALKDIPGSFINGVRLAFYQDFLGSGNAGLTQENLKNMIVDSLKYMKDSVDKFSEEIEDLGNRIEGLTLFQKNIIREIDKHSIRLNLLENELKEIKSFAGNSTELKISTRFTKEDAPEKKDSSYNNSMMDKNICTRKFNKLKKFTKKPSL